jgi:prepilin-type processing-associated H-X9-DG protein
VAAVKLEDVKKALEAQAKKLKDNKREMKVIEPKGVEGPAAAGEVVTEELFFDLLKALLNPATMPAPDSFTKHLFPAVSVTRRVEGGLLSESFSPLGFTGGLGTDAKGVAVVGIGIGLLLPAVSRVRENARTANSKSNLRQIGLGIHIWADDNDENFPPNLAALFPNYIDNKKVFVCPLYSKHAADGFDYAYVAGLRAADPGAYIMAFETLPNRNGLVNALYVDAHVQLLGLEELRKQLAEQAKKLKDDKREMKILEPKDVGRPGVRTDEVIISTDVTKEKAPPPAPPAPAPK